MNLEHVQYLQYQAFTSSSQTVPTRYSYSICVIYLKQVASYNAIHVAMYMNFHFAAAS